MAANEISERLRAAAWVQCGSVDGGEGLDFLSVDQIRYRSYVGFQNRIITTVNVADAPLVILPLDDVLSRSECAVFAIRHGTVSPTSSVLDRASYPQILTPADGYAGVFAQPCHLDWFGPDFTAPDWYPMGLNPGPISVPDGFDLNLFNAVAVLLPLIGGTGASGDFSILVLKHARLEGETTVEALLPAA